MQRWEYMVVGPIKFGSMSGWDAYYANAYAITPDGARSLGLNDSGDERSALATTIARLGEDGWEMTGCGTVGDEHRLVHYLYFKRSKE